MSKPTPTAAEARADELRARRAITAEQTRQIRLRRAVEALHACGCRVSAEYLPLGNIDRLCAIRDHVQGLRASLTDGGDEPRYAACGAALEALGALWCYS